jgi:hypothetical protein
MGQVPSKVYLASGVAKVPFQYVIQDRTFEVVAEVNQQKVRLNMPPEKGIQADEDAWVLDLGQDEAVAEDVIEEPQPTQTVAVKTEADEPWTIERGLQVVMLSGRTDLEAGGRDRTRMRLRLLDRLGNDIPDDAEVEIEFEQGRVLPSRPRVKRGVVKFQLKTERWVGRYPLIIRIDDVTKEIPISIRAPEGDGNFLPGLPTAPQWRGKGRRF